MNTPPGPSETRPGPMGTHRRLQPAGWPQPRGYANGIVAEGRLIVTGGIIGWDTQEVLPPTFLAQAKQAFENIAVLLKEAGATPEHLVRMTWFVTDMDEYLADLPGLGAAYRGVFGRNFPTMTAVQVVRLVEPAAKIEIEVTAVVPLA